MIKNSKIGVIILAAGASRRLGYAKQLVKFKNKALLQHAIDSSNFLNFDSRVLVLGANAAQIEAAIEKGNFYILRNDDWEEGMASSIQKGLEKSLYLESELEHILILLSDQPFINKEKIEDLINAQIESKSPATFSEYAGNVGVPAIFSSVTFPYFKKIEGDQGAKTLIKKEQFTFKSLKFENAVFDVDTQEDVELLKQIEKE